MFSRLRRGLAAASLIAGFAAGAVHASDFLDCAEFITSQFDDGPAMGELIGTSDVTYNIGVNPGGVGGSYSESFQVGYYRMTDGDVIRIDCRDYTYFA